MKNGTGTFYWWFACVVEGEAALATMQRAMKSLGPKAFNPQALEYDPTHQYGEIIPQQVKSAKNGVTVSKYETVFDTSEMPDTGRKPGKLMIAIWHVLKEQGPNLPQEQIPNALRAAGYDDPRNCSTALKAMQKQRLVSRNGKRWSAKYA